MNMNSPHHKNHDPGTASNRRQHPLKGKNQTPATKLRRLTCGVVGAAALAFTISTASAQTSANADTVYDGWINAYLQNTNVNGHTYPVPYICNSLTDRNKAFFWQQAYMISAIEDGYDKTVNLTRLNMVTSLCASFMAQEGMDWTWDGWNDDVEWAMIAMAHGYQITGNTSYRDAAAQNFNAVWTRGWSSDLGGGIWEKDTGTSKCVLSNAPFIIAGCMLYRATGDSTYLTRSQQAYTWMRSRCWNSSTGQLVEGYGAGGNVLGQSSSTPTWGVGNSYNSGIFLQAADALYQVTGTSSYLSDAQLTVNWVVNNHSIMTEDHMNNGPFGSEEFFRGLSLFARVHNLWGAYYPWLKANAQAAWNHRRTDYNITANNFNAATSTGNLLAMETVSSMIVQQVTSIDPSGTFELSNAASGQCLNVSGASTASGAAIVQWPYDGGSNSLWHFILNPANGSHQIVNLNSGLDAVVQNASTADGAKIIQAPFGTSGDDQWLVALTISGNRNLINLKSGKLLENPGSSTAQGTQMDQWGSNRGSNQRWQFIRR